VAADAVILTSPVPQTSSLLMGSGLVPPDGARWLGYDEVIALLVVLDRPSAVPTPGGVQDADETFSFIGDNEAKGISPVPAVTFHVRAALSHDRWNDDPAGVHADLLIAARPWLGAAHVVESQVKRWRFAAPTAPWPEPCVVMTGARGGPVVMAGDAFGGPKVEGAYRSGLASATAVITADL
jgi:predicted NAD/FAD-dependent oxidoreductase